MARRRGTSRVTEPGTGPGDARPATRSELPSIRQRRPVLYWAMVIAVVAMVVPLVAGLIQGLT